MTNDEIYKLFYKQKKHLSFLKFLDANPEVMEKDEEQSTNADDIYCPVCIAYTESTSERDQASCDTYDSNELLERCEGDRQAT